MKKTGFSVLNPNLACRWSVGADGGDVVVKTCRKCNTAAPKTDFPANKRMRDGRSSWCRRCHYEASSAWRGRNPEAIEGYNARRRVRHAPRTRVACGGMFVPRRKDSRRCSWCRGSGDPGGLQRQSQGDVASVDRFGGLPDPDPGNTVDRWSRHWSGGGFDPRCPDCRERDSACDAAVEWARKYGETA